MRVLLLAVAFVGVGVDAAAAKPSEAEQGKALLEQAIEAAGGAKALAAIEDVTLSGKLTATMADQEVDGTVTMIETREGATRDQMTLGGFEMIAASGPTGAFTSQAGISKTLTGNDLVQAQAQSRFTPLGLLLHGAEPGVVLRGLPQEDGMDVLEVAPPDADPLTFYFDAKTHLVSMLKVVSSTEKTTLVTRYSLYKPEAGVQMAHQLSVSHSGLAMVFTFDNVQVNAGAHTGLPSDRKKKKPPRTRKPAAETAAAVPEDDPPPANGAGEATTISVSNGTAKTLHELHFSPHGKKDWGANLLPVDRFHDGDTATVRFATQGDCLFDMMVADDAGHFWVVPNADLCKHNALSIRATKDGLALDAK